MMDVLTQMPQIPSHGFVPIMQLEGENISEDLYNQEKKNSWAYLTLEVASKFMTYSTETKLPECRSHKPIRRRLILDP